MRRKSREIPDEEFFTLNFKSIWRHFYSETFAFWMICLYLFCEYVRPQSIIPELDFLPWAQLSLFGALVGWLFEPNKRWVNSPVNKLFIIFFIIILLSSSTAYWQDVSFSKLKNIYVWMVSYFLIINIINTRKRFFIFLAIFALASFKISLSLAITWAGRGFSFAGWGLQGPPGFFQNSGELAIQMAVFWPIALAIAISLKKYVANWKYYLLLSMSVSAVMVILGASSRGGQLALIAQLVADNFRKVFRVKVLIVVGIVLSLGWWLLPQEQKERFEAIGEDTTSQQRLLYWENGLEMMNSHPFLGVGYYNFIPYFNQYYTDDLLRKNAELPHNIFIQVGADLGYSGLIIYLMLIFYGFKIPMSLKVKFIEKERNNIFYNLPQALNVSFLGFIIAGQFVSVVYYPFMWIHLALVVALNNIIVNKKTENKISTIRRR